MKKKIPQPCSEPSCGASENGSACKAPLPSPEATDERTETVQRTIHEFLHTDRLHRAAIERALADLGVHRSQHRMLVHLHRHGGSMAQSELASELDISPAAVAVTLRKLESAGYICRSTDGRDSRKKIIALTPEGDELLRVSYSAFTEVDLAMFSGLSAEELAAFSSMLARMRTCLQEHLAEGCDGRCPS